MLDQLLRRPHQKAESGVGAYWMSHEPSVGMLTRNPAKAMREYQSIAQTNRWIRSCERVISDKLATAGWHLEDADDAEITDESAAQYLAVRDLFEKPYIPIPGDPINASPKTRSALLKLTSRHMGVCGIAFWYLDQTTTLSGIPMQLLYVNPARMTPSVNGNGDLLGWVLDADQWGGGGTPLEANKVLVFPLAPPDFGWFPSGLVEAAMNDVNLIRYGDRHASLTLASGGRIAGVYSPKSGETIPEDKWKQLLRDLRTANESADATRRSVVLQGPIDFTHTAASPSELDLISTLNMARDDILALWGVPFSQIGGTAPAGLNSGGRADGEEAALWQNAIGPRARTIREIIQFELLDRYKELGIVVELEIEEPEFDDETPMFERAAAASGQPLTNAERRALLGMDPIGDPAIDNAIILPVGTVQFYQAPATGKASVSSDRDHSVAAITRDVTKVLDAMKRDIAAKSGHILSHSTDESAWWKPDHWRIELEKAIRPHVALAAERVPARVTASLGKADVGLPQRVLARLLAKVGLRITGILDTTRDMVRETIKAGIAAGDSMAQLGDRLEQSGAFGEYRAELIGRTETAIVLNEAALESYKEYGITEVTVDDGDQDDACAVANGSTWTLDEADADPIAHPNCVRSFSPVILTAKAAPVAPVADAHVAEIIALLSRTQENNVKAFSDLAAALAQRPIVVEPAQVTVNQPDIILPPLTVTVPEQRPMNKQVIRDEHGRITGVVETST